MGYALIYDHEGERQSCRFFDLQCDQLQLAMEAAKKIMLGTKEEIQGCVETYGEVVLWNDERYFGFTPDDHHHIANAYIIKLDVQAPLDQWRVEYNQMCEERKEEIAQQQREHEDKLKAIDAIGPDAIKKEHMVNWFKEKYPSIFEDYVGELDIHDEDPSVSR